MSLAGRVATSRAYGVVALGLLAIVCAACKSETPSAPDATTTSTATAALTKVSVNFTPSVSCAPLAIAKDAGYFADEGLDVSLEVLDMNSAVLGVATGGLDVFNGPVRPGLFNMMLKGKTMQIVADKGHSAPGTCAPEAFIAPTEIVERLRKPGATVRGMRFENTPGSLSDYLISRMIERQGVSRSEIEFTQVPLAGDFLGAGKNKLDSMMFHSEPNLTNLLEAGGFEIYATGEEIAPGHELSVMIYSSRLLRDDPDLGQRFMRAYLRGVARYNEGKTEENVSLIAGYTKLPPELIRKVCWQPIASDGHLDPEVIQDYIEWARGMGYVEGEVPTSLWWNPSFIEAAGGANAGDRQ